MSTDAHETFSGAQLNTRAQYVAITLELRTRMREKPMTALDVSEAVGLSRKTANMWLRTLHEARAIRPVGVQPRGRHATGPLPMMWRWVAE